MQRLRGSIAVRERALQPSQLTPDGRDASAIDDLAWHLLTLDEDGSVGGCVRMLVHPKNVRFSDLMISRTAIMNCPERAEALQSAVEVEIARAKAAGAAVVEVGGWVLSDRLRWSAEAVRLVLGVWAWGQILGGAVGFATATLRNDSACILGRIGGSALSYGGGNEISAYYEPKYACDIQILRFDTNSYRARYQSIVNLLSVELGTAPVLCTRSVGMPISAMSPASYGIPDLAPAASAA
jgi:hypothetical protein